MRCLIASIALATLLASPALAVKRPIAIQPGTYNLNWRHYESHIDSSSGFEMRKLSEKGAPKFKQKLPPDSYWGSNDKFFAVVAKTDKSKDYNTVYVFRVTDFVNPSDSSQPQKIYDLKDAIKVPVSYDGCSYASDKANPTQLDVTFGEPDNQVTQTFYVDVNMWQGKVNGKKTVESGSVKLRGGWFGKLQGVGEMLRIETHDMNNNGIYGDPVNKDSDGDAIIIIDKTETPGHTFFDSDTLYLSKAVLYRGKLYDVKVNKIGNQVDIQPYKGETGNLTVQLTPSSPSGTTWDNLELRSDSGIYELRSDLGNTFPLPVGEYTYKVTIQPPQKVKEGDYPFGFMVESKAKVSITKDGNTTLTLEGAPTINIVLTTLTHDTATVKRGEDLCINAEIKLGNCDYNGTRNGPSSTNIRLKDPSGKVVNECPNCGNDILTIDKSWKPGIYTVEYIYTYGSDNRSFTATKTVEIQ